MREYPVLCDCGRPAEFKIAAEWTDGHTAELKTYALCCGGCLPAALASARGRNAACRADQFETLEAPGVYEWVRMTPDRQLKRRPDLESA